MTVTLTSLRFNISLFSPIIFIMGIIIFSGSIFALWKFSRNITLILLAIFIAAFFIALIPFIRFNFFGADLIEEVYVAQITKQLGFWPINRIAPTTLIDATQITGLGYVTHQYFSSIAVTILPASISLMTGLPMLTVFTVLVPLVSAFIVIAIILVVRKIFGLKIALLSGIIFIFTYIFGVYSELLRQDLAILFFILSWYFLFKKERKSMFLSLIFIFMVPWLHYTVSYFLMLFVLSMYIVEKVVGFLDNKLSHSNRLPVNSFQKFLTKELVFFTFVANLAWFIFIAPSMFSSNLSTFWAFLQGIFGYGSGNISYQVAHVTSSSLGPFHTYIKLGIMALTGIGFLLGLIKLKNNKNSASFIFSGGALIVLLAFWIIVPGISAALNPDRIYSIGLIFFSTFMAISIFYLTRHLKLLGTFISTLFVILIALDSIAIPIYYTHSSEMASEFRYLFTPEYEIDDIISASWIQKYIPEKAPISSDSVGVRLIVAFSGHIASISYYNSTDISVLSKTSAGGPSQYFLIIKSKDGYYISLNPNKFFMDNSEFYRINKIYDNGKNALLHVP